MDYCQCDNIILPLYIPYGENSYICHLVIIVRLSSGYNYEFCCACTHRKQYVNWSSTSQVLYSSAFQPKFLVYWALSSLAQTIVLRWTPSSLARTIFLHCMTADHGCLDSLHQHNATAGPGDDCLMQQVLTVSHTHAWLQALLLHCAGADDTHTHTHTHTPTRAHTHTNACTHKCTHRPKW